jgi:heterodisulfide reductase subunit C/quinone-modifying oxidoreductase subunit QmoC
MELAMHYTYAVHLIIIVPMLIIEIPFGKWSHGLYRSLALYFYGIRENALQLQQQKLINLSTSEVK